MTFFLASCAVVPNSKKEGHEGKRDRIVKQQIRESDRFIQRLREEGREVEIVGFSQLTSELGSVLLSENNDVEVKLFSLPGENAFALPNGVIVIHLDLLASLDSVDQLSFVLAHEAGHIVYRHAYASAKIRESNRLRARLLGLVSLGLVNTNSRFRRLSTEEQRAQEQEADRYAWDRHSRAGFSIDPVISYFKALSKQHERAHIIFKNDSHPTIGSRARNLMLAKRVPESVRSDHPLLQAKFNRLRREALRRGIVQNFKIQNLEKSYEQLSTLRSIEGDSEFTACAEGDIFLSMAELDPVWFLERVLEINAQNNKAARVVYRNGEERNYLLKLASNAYRNINIDIHSGLVQAQNNEACLLRGQL